ncbi:MAG: SRPBCC family protein [Thermosynechococcaceae cyanobacterium]
MLELDTPTADREDLLADSDDVSFSLAKVQGRQRRIEASIGLPFTVEQVWTVLTDYETLSEFIPNLAASCRLPHPEGGIRIEQIGVQNLKVMTFKARVVLDMIEDFPSAIRFNMVEGDFKAFSGAWLLEPISSPQGDGTKLSYVLEVWPKATIPVIAIEQRLKKDLPQNLRAIRDRLSQSLHLCP